MPAGRGWASEVIKKEQSMDEKNAPVPGTTGNEREQPKDTLRTRSMVAADNIDVNRIPPELKDLRQWVDWLLRPNENGKPAKLPFNAEPGKLASVTDPSTWSSFETALQASDRYDGIGF